MTPFVIPFFIAHQGCPHQCVFCNQHAISGQGQEATLTAAQVRDEIKLKLAWPRHPDRPVQVAFYGGSFTGLPLGRREELLGAVAPFLARGEVQSIRVSTRPDLISPAIVDHLKERGVGLVELGVQSLDDEVLRQSGRGHAAAAVAQAFALLKEGGVQVGGQLMVGLPGESRRAALASAKKLAALRPDLVRMYPTLVMAGSGLAALFARGAFQPWSLAQCTVVCSLMKDIFDRHGIVVARLGLQSCPSLERDLLAGPYHPAFGELVLSRQYYKKVRAVLRAARQGDAPRPLTLRLAQRDRSLFVGLKRQNLARYDKTALLDQVEVVFLPQQPRFSVEVVAGRGGSGLTAGLGVALRPGPSGKHAGGRDSPQG